MMRTRFREGKKEEWRDGSSGIEREGGRADSRD